MDDRLLAVGFHGPDASMIVFIRFGSLARDPEDLLRGRNRTPDRGAKDSIFTAAFTEFVSKVWFEAHEGNQLGDPLFLNLGPPSSAELGHRFVGGGSESLDDASSRIGFGGITQERKSKVGSRNPNCGSLELKNGVLRNVHCLVAPRARTGAEFG